MTNYVTLANYHTCMYRYEYLWNTVVYSIVKLWFWSVSIVVCSVRCLGILNLHTTDLHVHNYYIC